ncbi:MAG: hypothetical protein OXG25_10110 [Gammaproteobacteria bacterium]|nr:hypothetical protein [Gammaproteobacteria bacterium]
MCGGWLSTTFSKDVGEGIRENLLPADLVRGFDAVMRAFEEEWRYAINLRTAEQLDRSTLR